MAEWRDIPKYEGLYQASDDGQIRTCVGKTTSNARYKTRVWKQRVLKQKRELRKCKRWSDARVTLWKDGQEKTWLVSRLVAMAWCDGYEEGLTVNHIDGNPENNHYRNLEWVSMRDNIRKGYETGLYHTQKEVKLTDTDGNEETFRSMSEASRFLGKSVGYVSNALKKGRYTCGEYRIKAG